MDPFGEAESAFEQAQNDAFHIEKTHPSDHFPSIDMNENQSLSTCDDPTGPNHTPFPSVDAATASQDVQDDELAAYNREWEEKLAMKASEQSQIAIECKDKAAADMDQFIAEREHLLESKKTINRAHEQAMLEKLEADLLNENPWERVVTLVDMKQPKSSKSENTKKSDKEKSSTKAFSKSTTQEIPTDVSRMRQIFLQLKREPLEMTRSIATH